MTTPTREQVVQWMEEAGFEYWVQGRGKSNEDFVTDIATLARADLEAELESLRKDAARLQQIAFLIGNIFAHGNFVAETFNERELEKLLRENGTFWESLEDFESQVYPAIAAAPKEK